MKNNQTFEFKFISTAKDLAKVQELFLRISNKALGSGHSAQFNWSANQITESLQKYSCFAGFNSESFACAFILFQKLASDIEILAIGTDPEALRVGLGARLFQNFAHKINNEDFFNADLQASAERESARFLLEVHEQNEAAIAFYLSLGFKIDSKRHSYYKDGAGALLMSRSRYL